jgi:hypothetical protein
LFKIVKKEYGNLGRSRIKLIIKEEERVVTVLEDKIRKIMRADAGRRDFLKESSAGKNLYNPLKKHIYFKASYVYLKKLMGNVKSSNRLVTYKQKALSRGGTNEPDNNYYSPHVKLSENKELITLKENLL